MWTDSAPILLLLNGCSAVARPLPGCGSAALTRRLLGGHLLASRDEARGLVVERGDGGGELVTGLLALGVEALELPDAPLAQQRRDDVVVVDAQVVDAGHRHLHGLAPEAGDDRARASGS